MKSKKQGFLTSTSVNVATELMNKRLHITGQIWTACALIMMVMVPVLMSIIYDSPLDWKLFFGGVGLLIYYLPVSIGEVFTYSYLLGVNGTYLAFVTGNLSNLKVPCVINAVNIVGTIVGTEEHEIACTISIAVSSIVNMLIIGIGVLCLSLSGLAEFLQSDKARFLTPAFGSVAFALFGALGGKYLVKYPKIALVPFIIMAVASVGLNLLGKPGLAQPGYFLFVGVILCFVFALVFFKKAEKKNKTAVATAAAEQDIARG